MKKIIINQVKKPLRRAEIEKEIKRYNYLLDKYKMTDDERAFIERCLKKAEIERDKIATKKEILEANQ